MFERRSCLQSVQGNIWPFNCILFGFLINIDTFAGFVQCRSARAKVLVRTRWYVSTGWSRPPTGHPENCRCQEVSRAHSFHTHRSKSGAQWWSQHRWQIAGDLWWFRTDSARWTTGLFHVIIQAMRIISTLFAFNHHQYYLISYRIGGHHPRKVVAKDWYGNGMPIELQGKLEMLQQSEYELTNIEVRLKNLERNSGYHVHIVSHTNQVCNFTFTLGS